MYHPQTRRLESFILYIYIHLIKAYFIQSINQVGLVPEFISLIYFSLDHC